MSLMAVKTVCKLMRVPPSSTVASGRREVVTAAAAAAAAAVVVAALRFPPMLQHATATVRYEHPPKKKSCPDTAFSSLKPATPFICVTLALVQVERIDCALEQYQQRYL
jgi:hypothetical protein